MKDNDILGAVRESLDGVHLDRPVETVMAAGHSRRRRTTAVRMSIASLAVAALGAGALVFNGIGGLPASDGGAGPGAAVLAHNAGFTLARSADGAITFTINDVVDTEAATAALNNAGITGRVVKLGADPNCPTTSASIDPTDTYPDDTNTRAFGSGPSTATFRSSDYPAGGGLLLVLLDFEGGPQHPSRPPVDPDPPVVFVVAFDDAAKIPTCINADVD
ncbi:MAG TPA: hypothetical protein VFC19_42240 [Candidatus Limnocylindrales bacterium]|nr:hypothetical protein [Candidatus Limnocylindrales bacterium]